MPAVIDKIADALHIPRHHKHEEGAHAETSATTTPVFDSEKVTVLFVLGGPGAGMQ